MRLTLHGPVKSNSGEESAKHSLRSCPTELKDGGYISFKWEESGKCWNGGCCPDGVRQVQLWMLSETPDYNVYRTSVALK